MMRFCLSILLISSALAGCQRDTAVESTPASPAAHAVSNDNLAELFVYTTSTELNTVEQLTVTIELLRSPDTEITFSQPDWEANGWTLLGSHAEPETLFDDQYRSSWSFIIEPFLAGSYEVPSIRFSTNSETLETEPIAITVQSVLTEDDDGTLANGGELVIPSEPAASSTPVLLSIAAGVGLITAASVLWWIGRAEPQVRTTPVDQLRRVADGEVTDSAEALSIIYNAIGRMSEQPAFASIRTACEYALYSDSEKSPADTSTEQLATQALLALEDAR